MANRNEFTDKDSDVRGHERQGEKKGMTRQDFLKAGAGLLTVSFMSGSANGPRSIVYPREPTNEQRWS